MNVLVSSAGRRGQLVRLIRDTIQPLGGRVHAIDASEWSAACRIADSWGRVSRCDHATFEQEVLDYCLANEIRLVIPTIDTELPMMARFRARFAACGIDVATSGIETISIAADKVATARFLADANLPTVKTYSEQEIARGEVTFPALLKPRFGSASSGIHIIQDVTELQFFWQRVADPIVQELATGREYTVNFYIDRQKIVRAAVPHWRVETRGGEVSKCVTVRQEQLITLAREIGDRLPSDAWGPMCYQAFVAGYGKIKIIEINARLGGGYPIAHSAGANFLQMLIDDVLGNSIASVTDWQAGLAMTRWDDAVFTAMPDIQERVA